MRRRIGVLGAILVCVAGTPAAADTLAEPTNLEPTTPWQLDYGDERCSLGQQYGSGDESLVLQIDSYGSWRNFRVTLAGRGVPASARPAGLAASVSLATRSGRGEKA